MMPMSQSLFIVVPFFWLLTTTSAFTVKQKRAAPFMTFKSHRQAVTALGYSDDAHVSEASTASTTTVRRDPVRRDAATRPGTFEIHSVTSPQDFVDFLAKDERLVVVKVGANWCKVCKSFDIRWRKLASKLADRVGSERKQERGRVRFCEIEFTEHEDLCRGLQATRLPHVLVFRGAVGSAGLVDNFQCSPANFQRVVDTVNTCLELEGKRP
jgi:thiol-disulfide isomerase/thioredoxin